jgi:hypothetical protein
MERITDRKKIADRFNELESSRAKALKDGDNAWADQISGELVGLTWVLDNCEFFDKNDKGE